jgi:hypothetical protein
MKRKDMDEFNAYLAGCTDDQVRAVRDKELAAHRRDYAALASAEMKRRGIF